jgi:hypothetical protein
LTDHDRLWSRIWTVVVLGLTLISFELIRLIAALSCNALLDPEIRPPNVPLWLPPKVALPASLWLAPVPFVNHGSGTLGSFIAERLTQRLALHVALDDGGAGSDVDGRARAGRSFEAFRCSLDVEMGTSMISDFESRARGAALVLDGLDSAGRDAVSLDGAIAATAAAAGFTTAEGAAVGVRVGVAVSVSVSVSVPAVDDSFSRDLGHRGWYCRVLV